MMAFSVLSEFENVALFAQKNIHNEVVISMVNGQGVYDITLTNDQLNLLINELIKLRG